MKDKILFVMAFMCVMVLASCGGGDDGDSSGGGYRSSIVGVWEVISFQKSSSVHVEGGCKVGDRIYFNSDGTYKDAEDTGRWSLSGNIITISLNDGSIPGYFEIKNLSSSSLELYLDYGFLQAIIKCKRVDGGSGGVTPSGPSTFYMDVNMGSRACSQTIELTNLKTSISTATSSASWLTVLKQPYSSGSPQIQIDATANPLTSSRNCTVTVTAADGDKVIITVVQKEHSQPETNDEVSDKEALSRELQF